MQPRPTADNEYERLALSVLAAAVSDTRQRVNRHELQEFWNDSIMLQFWCAVAGLNATSLGQDVQRRYPWLLTETLPAMWTSKQGNGTQRARPRP